MRTCVIFNPAAKGDKARHFRAQLDIIAATATLKKTAAPQDARRLAAAAVAENFATIVAAGGDGTLNEVLNGIADADGFDRVRLGILPLGTVNVLALELGIPFGIAPAWNLILRGREMKMDLGFADFSAGGRPQRRWFAQLGGAGLDARAIELVDWRHKKSVGPLAYVIAGLRAWREPQPKITVTADGQSTTGELLLFGNGKCYGGRHQIFPGADLRDGRLDVCVFPRVSWPLLLRGGVSLLMRGRLPENAAHRRRAAAFAVTAAPGAGFELDGEYIGRLPATFGVEREKLRVLVP